MRHTIYSHGVRYVAVRGCDVGGPEGELTGTPCCDEGGPEGDPTDPEGELTTDTPFRWDEGPGPVTEGEKDDPECSVFHYVIQQPISFQ